MGTWPWPLSGSESVQSFGSAFADETGTPVVLNTSFNENEPIVESPEQALDCFFRTAMDAVVIENTLVQRQPVEAAAGDVGAD